MGVTSWMLRHTAPRPLVLTAPGGTEQRLAVERHARERGWRLARSPAEANVLVVAGGGLEPYATRVWQAIPAPRVRVEVAADVPAALTAAVAMLRDAGEQRKQAESLLTTQEHEGAHEHAAMAHGGHDHHMAGMEMPGGVPMADRAPDRDGLMLDQLHVPLGPALPLWPPGLIVHTRLQGDVIQDASAELTGTDDFWPRHPVARRLDAAACLLALTGWADAAATARLLRDAALAGDLAEAPRRRWATRVRRSRTLRWLLTGVGRAETGDAQDRLHRWLDLDDPDTTPVDDLPDLLAGTELATARLLIASLDLGVRHG